MSNRLPLLLLLVPLAACSGGGAPETVLEESFCDILENGPSETVAATTDANGPEVALADTAVTVTLVDDGTGSFSGNVAYTTDEAGSFVIGLSDDVPLTVVDANGQTIAFDAEVTVSSCGALAIRYTVPLELDSYTLELGPTDLAEVSIVSEESDDDL